MSATGVLIAVGIVIAGVVAGILTNWLGDRPGRVSVPMVAVLLIVIVAVIAVLTLDQDGAFDRVRGTSAPAAASPASRAAPGSQSPGSQPLTRSPQVTPTPTPALTPTQPSAPEAIAGSPGSSPPGAPVTSRAPARPATRSAAPAVDPTFDSVGTVSVPDSGQYPVKVTAEAGPQARTVVVTVDITYDPSHTYVPDAVSGATIIVASEPSGQVQGTEAATGSNLNDSSGRVTGTLTYAATLQGTYTFDIENMNGPNTDEQIAVGGLYPPG